MPTAGKSADEGGVVSDAHRSDRGSAMRHGRHSDRLQRGTGWTRICTVTTLTSPRPDEQRRAVAQRYRWQICEQLPRWIDRFGAKSQGNIDSTGNLMAAYCCQSETEKLPHQNSRQGHRYAPVLAGVAADTGIHRRMQSVAAFAGELSMHSNVVDSSATDLTARPSEGDRMTGQAFTRSS
jgi:hypothetical protein